MRFVSSTATVLALTLVHVGFGAAHAEVLTYRPTAKTDRAPAVRIDIPYTFGTHEFEVRDLKGEVRVDWQAPASVSGRLSVPLSALRGGGETIGCHTREALGLDYAKSAFPGQHVCSGGKLPTSGNDAIAFPEITFEIRRGSLGGPKTIGAPGQSWRMPVSGRWTIHGVTRDDTIDLRLTVSDAGNAARPRSIHVEGMRRIRLSDYGIKVKRALVIAAGEEATVKIDLVLEVSG